MRANWLAAGAMVLAAACGGEKPAEQAAAAPAAAAPATGTTHEVQMTMVGADYRFVPSDIAVKVGDAVKFTNTQATAHNVQFYPDSIPAGAAAVLDANMPNRMGPLASNLLLTQNETYTISFAGAPVGEYHFTCLPHMALGMHGKVTVTQ
jgi:plastocyanin